MYVYTYNFHVDLNNANKSTLDAFGMSPDNPNARAHLADCLTIKIVAFERTYNHICDILHFIENPAADEKKYDHKSQPYPTDSYLQESPIETRPIRDVNGCCLLGKSSDDPSRASVR